MKIRKKKLIKSALQVRVIASFLGLAVVCSFVQVFLLNRSVVQLSERLDASEKALLSEMPEVLGGNLTVTLCVLVPIMLLFGVFITHRIAGPIHRLEQYLSAVARGEDTGPCSLRRGDDLMELCDKVNAAVAELKRQGEERDQGRRAA